MQGCCASKKPHCIQRCTVSRFTVPWHVERFARTKLAGGLAGKTVSNLLLSLAGNSVSLAPEKMVCVTARASPWLTPGEYKMKRPHSACPA